jgi:hypothetical protein
MTRILPYTSGRVSYSLGLDQLVVGGYEAEVIAEYADGTTVRKFPAEGEQLRIIIGRSLFTP